MARIIIVHEDFTGKVLDLEGKDAAVIGRDPACDLVLDHPDVSRRHAQVEATAQGYLLRDLGSTHGTSVGGQMVGERLLAAGDEISFGPVKARVELPGVKATRLRATVVRGPQMRLWDQEGVEYPLEKDVFLVGRDRACDLVLNQDSISGRHAELRPTPQGLMVRDLDSTNGTFVNGQRVSGEKLAHNGDAIAFDVVKFKLEISGGPAATRLPAPSPLADLPDHISPAAAQPVAAAPPPRKSGAGLWAGLAVAAVIFAGAAWYFLAGPGKPAPAPPTPAAVAKDAPAPAPASTVPARQVVERLVFNHVWTFTAGDKVFSSPAVGDINGDGVLDVVVGANDGLLYVVDGKTGRRHWSWRADAAVVSSPLLADLTKDGGVDIVFGSDDGKLYALNGQGQRVWVAPDDAKGGAGNELQSSPAAADLDGDNVPDIVIGSQNGKVYALSGERGWELWNSGSIMKAGVFATPALTDVDGDKVADVLVGALDNNFYCLNGKKGWKVWEFACKAPVKASAAVVDLDRDGKPEVVFASADGTVYALHAADGLEMWRFETGSPIESSPAAADLNGDGVPDVIVAQIKGKLTALNGKTGQRIWELDLGGAQVLSSPVVHDLNGDGVADIIVCDGNGIVRAVSGVTGWELANFTLNAEVVSSPALADVNGDGFLDVIVGVADNNLVVLTLNAPVAKGAVLWPNFRRNQGRTG